MADVTISQLSAGTPNSNAVIPFSQGGSTLKASPSGIVAASPGAIIKVANSTYATQRGSTNNTWIDTGLECSITPLSNSSKILIFANISGIYKETITTAIGLRLLRGDNVILYFEATAGLSNSVVGVGGSSCSYLDSPASNSLVNYKVQFRNQGNQGGAYVQTDYGGFTPSSTMTLMEIAG